MTRIRQFFIVLAIVSALSGCGGTETQPSQNTPVPDAYPADVYPAPAIIPPVPIDPYPRESYP